MSGVLAGKVCVVTGASRGIGKGIALQLGEAGATVYVTGRTMHSAKDGTPGSLQETADEVQARGGKCIPVQCDHGNALEVEAFFERVKREQDGQLDILVNNAFAACRVLTECINKPFYELEPDVWDAFNNVGLRNNYVCSVYASRLMVPRKQGLIVNISNVGGMMYLGNVPFGVGKTALDRMAADCAHELRKENVAFVSLWPGAVLTELNQEFMNTSKDEKVKNFLKDGESPEYSGKCIVRLATDPKIMTKSGRIHLTAELGDEYGITDVDGRKIDSFRKISFMFKQAGYGGIGQWLPNWLRIPFWVLAMTTHKF